MSTRYYPLYQRGNPQLRVFLPNFWMKLIKSEEPLPPNVVLFQTSIEMTKYDIKNYLEKIYKVPVVDVKETIKMGRIKPMLPRNSLVKEDDYKEALVYMPKNYSFEFPEIGNEVHKEGLKAYKQSCAEFKEKERQKKKENFRKPFVPSWF